LDGSAEWTRVAIAVNADYFCFAQALPAVRLVRALVPGARLTFVVWS